MKKKQIMWLTVALCLVLTGCGKAADHPDEDTNKENTVAEEQQAGAPEGTDSGNVPESAGETAQEQIYNNGGSFVKAGTKVYYRQYPAKAYTTAQLFGEFINGMPCGQECSIMCFDEAVKGSAEEVMTDYGTGALVYWDGMLFSTCYESYDSFYVYVTDLSKRTSDKLCDGKISCMDSETGRFAVVSEQNDIVELSVYQGTELLDRFSVEKMQPFREMRLQGEYLVYRVVDKSAYDVVEPDGTDRLWVRNIREQTDLCLGDLPDSEEENLYYGKDIDQIIICEDTVYAAVGFYAGTGYFYNDGYLCRASLKQENSLEEMDWGTVRIASHMKYEADTLHLLESALPELVRTDRQLYDVLPDYETGYYTVLLPGDTQTEPVIKNVVKVPGVFDDPQRELVERNEYVDGALYMIIDEVDYNAEESIGWRDAYDIKGARYVRVDVETGMMEDLQPPIDIAYEKDSAGGIVSYYIENPAAGECYGASDRAAESIAFTEAFRDEQGWIDEDLWLAENNFSREDLYCPGYSFGLSDAYDRGTHRGYCLLVYSEEPGGTSYEIDLSDFYDPLCLEEQYRDAGWPAEYQYAYVEDNILYVAMYHMTYADSMPYNAYIVAIDLSDGTLLWKSRPLTCNSRDFLLMDDVVICGYGFTAEDDFLYQLSKYTGEIVQTTKIKSKADYIFYRDDRLYVQTYNTAYEYTR